MTVTLVLMHVQRQYNISLWLHIAYCRISRAMFICLMYYLHILAGVYVTVLPVYPGVQYCRSNSGPVPVVCIQFKAGVDLTASHN